MTRRSTRATVLVVVVALVACGKERVAAVDAADAGAIVDASGSDAAEADATEDASLPPPMPKEDDGPDFTLTREGPAQTLLWTEASLAWTLPAAWRCKRRYGAIECGHVNKQPPHLYVRSISREDVAQRVPDPSRWTRDERSPLAIAGVGGTWITDCCMPKGAPCAPPVCSASWAGHGWFVAGEPPRGVFVLGAIDEKPRIRQAEEVRRIVQSMRVVPPR